MSSVIRYDKSNRKTPENTRIIHKSHLTKLTLIEIFSSEGFKIAGKVRGYSILLKESVYNKRQGISYSSEIKNIST